MTSTNEDATVLATAPLGDNRLLVMRHLPDRETIELGWWSREEAGPTHEIRRAQSGMLTG